MPPLNSRRQAIQRLLLWRRRMGPVSSQAAAVSVDQASRESETSSPSGDLVLHGHLTAG
jgi:hypothetical protein